MAIDYHVHLCTRCGDVDHLFNPLVPQCASCGGRVYWHAFEMTTEEYDAMTKAERKAWGEQMRKQYALTSPNYDKNRYDNRAARDARIEANPLPVYADPNQPKCITCGSYHIHKIKVSSKAGSALVFGLFAAGRMSKTWHCDDCGTEW